MTKVIRKIGASKLATVSECQTPQGTHVALKEYDRQVLPAFQRDRIFSGAERWKSLNCPGMVRYLDVVPDENKIIMEIMDRSAAVRLSEGHSDPRLVLHALRDILVAVSQLHELGYLHVNLKPTNVFFDTNGRARLSDGLLVPINNPGTLPPPINQKYLTPEHTSDSFGPMSPATDLYTAGFMALELLAGDRFGRAFQGIGDDAAEDDLAWFQWHGSAQEAPSAVTFSKVCPGELTAVIARLVAKNPSRRYSTAKEALNELPQDISVQIRGQTPGSAAQAPQKREALATHVLDRPATGVVLAIASGPRAGELIGTNETEMLIGFDHDCFVRFSPDQYTQGGSKVLLRRGPEGWYVLRVAGDTAFVNQRQLSEKLTLRSGDIVRLSPYGPDIQFTMQTGGVAIRSLVNRFLPSQSGRPGRPLGKPGFDAPPAPPQRPAASAEPAAAPNKPRSAAAGQSAAPQPASPRPSPSQPQSAPAANPQPSGKNQASAPAPPKRPRSDKVHDAFKPKKAANEQPPGPWTDPKSWNKKQKNTVIAVVGGILVLLVVILFPTSKPKPPNEEPDNPTVPSASATAEGAAGSTTASQEAADGTQENTPNP